MGHRKTGGGWDLPAPNLEDYIMTWKIVIIVEKRQVTR